MLFTQKTSSLLKFAAFMMLAPIAYGHVDHGGSAGFMSGFSHPMGGLDHVLAMVAVGLWGAVLGLPALWVLPVVFPLMMAVGGAIGLLGWHLPAVEVGIALSAVVIGAMVFFKVRLPLLVSIGIVGLFALFHGHAHGTEFPSGGNAMWYSAGFVVGTGLLHTVGIAIGALNARKFGNYVIKGSAGGVVIGGAFFLWQALLG